MLQNSSIKIFCKQEWSQALLQTEPLPGAAAHPGEELKVRGLPGPEDMDHHKRHLVRQDGWPPGYQGVPQPIIGNDNRSSGLSAMAEALLRDPNQLSLVRESGQV